MTTELTRNRGDGGNGGERPAVRPRVDIYENDDEYLVVADMPGVGKDDLRINLHAGRLTLEGEVRSLPDDSDALEREFTVTLFRRSFDVPDTIDTAKVSADLNQGVLSLHLPKQEQVKPRKIPVHTG